MTKKKTLKLLKGEFDEFDYNETQYNTFEKINGKHPFQDKAKGAYVNYEVRSRSGGEVVYFNFDLAIEMGLIPRNHPRRLYKRLVDKIIDTFGIVIINEFDIINDKKFSDSEIKKHKYMATRYLQLQHPTKKGETSGDGRSIWNGCYKSPAGVTWDVTSCGTGATKLSPATAKHGKYFETGDPTISYGCGYAELLDGISGAILSDIFHKNGITTERCLAVIEYEGELSINVRAGRNLLRPSHFFSHLKQNNYSLLKSTVDYYIDREISNKTWIKSDRNKYKSLLKNVCDSFAKISAIFESEYIFCWLDWDGDNILTDGGIIDYGSIRQFGLFHHEYRYDDDDRWSTNLLEQKQKAKYIVQTFAQLCDYLIGKKKRNLRDYSKHPILDEFEEKFIFYKRTFLLKRIGFTAKWSNILVEKYPDEIQEFQKIFDFFERAKSNKGPRRVPDGITTDAIFCMRDILRELPQFYLHNPRPIDSETFLDILKSSYAPSSKKLSSKQIKERAKTFQLKYFKLIKCLSVEIDQSAGYILRKVNQRSAIINRYEKVTGDAIIYVAQKFVQFKAGQSVNQFIQTIENFICQHIWNPDVKITQEKRLNKKQNEITKKVLNIVKTHSEGL